MARQSAMSPSHVQSRLQFALAMSRALLIEFLLCTHRGRKSTQLQMRLHWLGAHFVYLLFFRMLLLRNLFSRYVTSSEYLIKVFVCAEIIFEFLVFDSRYCFIKRFCLFVQKKANKMRRNKDFFQQISTIKKKIEHKEKYNKLKFQ